MNEKIPSRDKWSFDTNTQSFSCSLTSCSEVKKDLLYKSYFQFFLNRVRMMFKWNNLPETTPERELEIFLMTSGKVFFTKYEGDYYFFRGGMGGEPNEYYIPTLFVFANPYLNYSASLKIGEEGIVIRNTSTLDSLVPLLSKYAWLLTECDITIYVALVNSRIPSLISATNDETYSSAVQFLNDIKNGEIGIISSEGLLEALKTQPFSGGSSVDLNSIIEMKQYLLASFYNDLGLESNYNMKRERLNTAEVGMNTYSLFPLIDDMLNERKKACEDINKLYGLNISVEFNSSWEDENDEREDSKNLEDNKENNNVDNMDSNREDKKEDEGRGEGE